MNRRQGIISICALSIAMLIGSQAFAKPPTNFTSLIGTWSNTNSATTGIVKVVIRAGTTGGITIRPYGACSPTPCDHGVISTRTFSSSVSSALAAGFNAAKNFGFKTTAYSGILSGTRLVLVT